ncbi:hypothetical protein CDAR_452411 [Caerostris darwini]|uniref:Uncharacterized protein n=1 Tax=Caerostris darwini TaxID=1538125 RepID=A0AAV4VRA6_9ARAC|nr:hypothetical protein CDAR_452411 [Caerostris darwini]
MRTSQTSSLLLETRAANVNRRKPHSLVDAHNQSAPLNTSPATTCVRSAKWILILPYPTYDHSMPSTKHQPTVPRTLLNSSCGKHTQCFASDKACDMGIPEF